MKTITAMTQKIMIPAIKIKTKTSSLFPASIVQSSGDFWEMQTCC